MGRRVDRRARDHRRAAYADAGFAASTASKQLRRLPRARQATVGQLAANPQIAQILEHPAGCTLTFAGLAGPDKSHVDILDAAGKVACSSHPKRRRRTRRTRRATWLPSALAKPQLVAPRRDSATGVEAVVITVPIAGGKGAIAGFVDLQSIGPALASLYSGGHPDEFLVTSADGRTVIARSVDPARWIGHPLGTTGYATIADTGERDDLDGISRLYASATVAGPGWHFYVGERTELSSPRASGLERRGFAVVLAGLLAALLAVFLMQRSLVRPIRRLQASLRTARETGTVATGGPRELRRLADDVNTLVSSLNRELVERERIEDRIAESERSYRLLFESNPSPMWVYDVETLAFLAVNDAAVQTYGYTREEFLAMTIEEIRPPDEPSTPSCRRPLGRQPAPARPQPVRNVAPQAQGRDIPRRGGRLAGSRVRRASCPHRARPGHHRPVRGRAGASRQRSPLPRSVRERDRPDRHRRSGRPLHRRQPCVRGNVGLRSRGARRQAAHERRPARMARRARRRTRRQARRPGGGHHLRARPGRARTAVTSRSRWRAGSSSRTACRRGSRRSAATSPNARASKSSCGSRSAWRRSAASPAGSPTTSTTS